MALACTCQAYADDPFTWSLFVARPAFACLVALCLVALPSHQQKSKCVHRPDLTCSQGSAGMGQVDVL